MKLICDFNLREGDSIINQSEQDTLIIASLLYKPFAGKQRLHWYLHSLNDPVLVQSTWVEGIGRLNDIIQSTITSETDTLHSFLLCFSENGENKYQDPGFSDCSFATASNNLVNYSDKLVNQYVTKEGLLNVQLV